MFIAPVEAPKHKTSVFKVSVTIGNGFIETVTLPFMLAVHVVVGLVAITVYVPAAV